MDIESLNKHRDRESTISSRFKWRRRIFVDISKRSRYIECTIEYSRRWRLI